MRRLLCRIGLHWYEPSPDPTTWQCAHCWALARHH